MTYLGFLLFRIIGGGTGVALAIVISCGMFAVAGVLMMNFHLSYPAGLAGMAFLLLPTMLLFVPRMLGRTNGLIDASGKEWDRTAAFLHILLSQYCEGEQSGQTIRLIYRPTLMRWFDSTGSGKSNVELHSNVKRLVYDTLRQQGGLRHALRHAQDSFVIDLHPPSMHQYLSLRAQYHPFLDKNKPQIAARQ